MPHMISCKMSLRALTALLLLMIENIFTCSWVQVLSVAVRIQSPSTAPDKLQQAVTKWLVSFRQHLQQLPAEELSNSKQVRAAATRRFRVEAEQCLHGSMFHYRDAEY